MCVCVCVGCDEQVVDGMAWFGGKVLFGEYLAGSCVQKQPHHRRLFLMIAGIEFIGEVVANVLGLNESRYQWVMDTMNEQEWETARHAEEHWVESVVASNMEGGAETAPQPDTPTERTTEPSVTSEQAANLKA